MLQQPFKLSMCACIFPFATIDHEREACFITRSIADAASVLAHLAGEVITSTIALAAVPVAYSCTGGVGGIAFSGGASDVAGNAIHITICARWLDSL